ncbi:MAG: AAA family ATPase, partial [Calditrichia bacterium]
LLNTKYSLRNMRRRLPSPAKWMQGLVERERIEANCLIDEVEPLADTLKNRVIGQDEALDLVICSFSRLFSGLRDPSRPLLTALLLGPTGVGKTETAKALAQTLFGSERAMTRVNSEEYAHGHELSKLLGSPPGYVGYNTEPLLSRARIDKPHQLLRQESGKSAAVNPGLAEQISFVEKDKYISVILFDEIEKAHPVMWNALLGILEDGMLTLGSNTTTDFTRSVILMTSNVGSREMAEFVSGKPMGFHRESDTAKLEKASMRDIAFGAAKKVFPFEFLNRFDEILVYASLQREHLEKIFDKFLIDIQNRALRQAGVPLLIKVSREAMNMVIDKGSDRGFGARPLRRAMERELVDPLSRFIALQKVFPGDVVEVEAESNRLAFYRALRSHEGLIV